MPDPVFQQTVLDNGLRVLTSEMPHTRSATVAIVAGGGSRYETDEQAGAFHYVEHLFFKGTPTRPTPQMVSEAIEGVGGFMNASTDRETTVYWCKVAHIHSLAALDLLMDMLRNSLFDPKEIEKERGVILEELSSSNDHPDERVRLLIDQTLWPGQAVGRDIGGTPASVRSLSREAMLGCIDRQYVPSNVVVAAAGNISHRDVVECCSRYLDGWTPGEPGAFPPAVDGQDGPRVSLERRRSDQAHICLAVRGLPDEHPQRYALDLLSVVLGEGMSSRLFLELRERRGLVYDVQSGVRHLRDTGTLAVYSAMDPRNARTAVRVVLEELNRLKEGIPGTEMAKAREYAKGRLLLRMEDTSSVAMWLGVRALLRGTVASVDDVVEQLERVTGEDVQAVARDLIVPERMSLAVVGPFRSQAQFERLLDGQVASRSG